MHIKGIALLTNCMIVFLHGYFALVSMVSCILKSQVTCVWMVHV